MIGARILNNEGALFIIKHQQIDKTTRLINKTISLAIN